MAKRVSILLHTDLQLIRQRLHSPLDDNLGQNIQCDESGERHVCIFLLALEPAFLLWHVGFEPSHRLELCLHACSYHDILVNLVCSEAELAGLVVPGGI